MHLFVFWAGRKGFLAYLLLFFIPLLSGCEEQDDEMFLLEGAVVQQNAEIAFDDIFNLYFDIDFDDKNPGTYDMSEWKEDWNYPEKADIEVKPEIVAEQSSGSRKQFMRWLFPEGSVGPGEGGGQWNTKLQDGLEELYFTYNLRFREGFEWVGGGKVPGVRGGTWRSLLDPPSWGDGFMVMLMWKDPGKLAFYYYHHNLDHPYGDLDMWDHPIETGKWYNVTIRIVLNTVDENGGNNDGILEGFIDGELVAQLDNVRFRNVNDITIDRLHITSFFGGSGDEFAAVRNEWIDMDDVTAFTYQPEVKVVRGNRVSDGNRLLILPHQIKR